MRRTVWLVILVLAVFGVIAWIWPTIYRYDKIIIDQDTYIVRIHRITGHADILVPEQGWVRSEDPWDSGSSTSPGDGHT